MDINTQINRGMERLMCRREGARLQGVHGLAGFDNAESFSGLAGLLEEAGFKGVGEHVSDLKRTHNEMCYRVRRALPVAVDAARLMERTGGDLSGIFSKVGKALKKVAKNAAKLSPSHQLIKKVAPKAAMISPAQMLTRKLEAKRVKSQAQIDAAAAKKAAKAAAKQAKKDAKAAKKAAKAAAALAAANAQNLPPTAAGAAVLANESGVLATPEAQAFAQEVVANAAQPGSTAPSMSMDEAAPGVDDTIFGIPKPWAIGGGLALAGLAVYAIRRRGR